MADSDAPSPPGRPITSIQTALSRPGKSEPPTPCDRCGADMYRMHSVWRCPACGFKSDCCGW